MVFVFIGGSDLLEQLAVGGDHIALLPITEHLLPYLALEIAVGKAGAGKDRLQSIGGFFIDQSKITRFARGKGGEVDVPLNYADYYFLESLMRFRNLSGGRNVLGR